MEENQTERDIDGTKEGAGEYTERMQHTEEVDVTLKAETVGVENDAGTRINPAKEETVESIDTKVATESSLTSTLDRNIKQVGGTEQSGVDLDLLLKKNDLTFDADGNLKTNIRSLVPTEDEVKTRLNLDDGGGTYGEIYRRNNAIRQSIENDQVGLLKTGDQPLDVSDKEVDVDLNTNTAGLLEAADQPLDVSAAEVDVDISSFTYGTLPVEQQTPVGVENAGGTQINPATESSLTSEQPRRVSDHDEDTYTVANGVDISGGVSQSLDAGETLTIFINVAGAIDITVEMSPDGGSNWYTLDESPYSFSSSGDRVEELGYRATDVKFTGSNTTATTIQILEVQ